MKQVLGCQLSELTMLNSQLQSKLETGQIVADVVKSINVEKAIKGAAAPANAETVRLAIQNLMVRKR